LLLFKTEYRKIVFIKVVVCGIKHIAVNLK